MIGSCPLSVVHHTLHLNIINFSVSTCMAILIWFIEDLWGKEKLKIVKVRGSGARTGVKGSHSETIVFL